MGLMSTPYGNLISTARTRYRRFRRSSGGRGSSPWLGPWTRTTTCTAAAPKVPSHPSCERTTPGVKEKVMRCCFCTTTTRNHQQCRVEMAFASAAVSHARPFCASMRSKNEW